MNEPVAKYLNTNKIEKLENVIENLYNVYKQRFERQYNCSIEDECVDFRWNDAVYDGKIYIDVIGETFIFDVVFTFEIEDDSIYLTVEAILNFGVVNYYTDEPIKYTYLVNNGTFYIKE